MNTDTHVGLEKSGGFPLGFLARKRSWTWSVPQRAAKAICRRLLMGKKKPRGVTVRGSSNQRLITGTTGLFIMMTFLQTKQKSHADFLADYS